MIPAKDAKEHWLSNLEVVEEYCVILQKKIIMAEN
jgi:hypothetical protein